MQTALTIWNGRISPVFDTAREVLIVQTVDAGVIAQRRETFIGLEPIERVHQLHSFGVNALVCGAISRELAEMVQAAGIELYAFVAGEVGEVIQAYLAGQLPNSRLTMPGCGGFRGCGWNQGARRRVRGGFMNGVIDYVNGVCVCRKCGHSQPHQRGVPCSTVMCPQCGTPMVRGEK